MTVFFSLQIQGEAAGSAKLRYYISEAAAAVNIQGNGRGGSAILLEQGVAAPKYQGMVGTVMTISRQEGPKYVEFNSPLLRI